MHVRRNVRWVGFSLGWLLIAFPAGAEDFTNAIRAFLEQRVLAKRDVGVVVGLVDERGSRVVAFGKLEDGSGRAVDGDTVFEIGSITKTFTALLLQDMVARGEMRLEDPVAMYLPKSVKVPTRNGREITLLQLATHTSGLPTSSITWMPDRAENPRSGYTVEKLYDFVSDLTLTRDPGTKYEYSTAGMALLGQAIALKAGTNYETLVMERICRPLKLDSTRFALTPEMKSRFATGHNYCGYAVAGSYWGALGPGAALRSTANDLLKYLAASLGLTSSGLTSNLNETHLVRFQAHQDTDTGLETDIGLGWMITGELDGSRIVQHGGLTDGFMSYVCFDTRRRRGVVVLSNLQDFELYKLGRLLLAGEWDSKRRAAGKASNRELDDAYVGQYQETNAPAAPRIGIRREGDRLFARATGSASWPVDVLLPPLVVELVPEWAGHFRERMSGTPVTFSRDTQGRVTELTVQYEGIKKSYAKISDTPPKPPDALQPLTAIKLEAKLLDDAAGRYEFAPGAAFPKGAKMKIWREGDQLVAQATGQNAIQGAFDIFPASETNFFIKINGAQLRLIKNDGGKATAIVYHAYGGKFPDCQGTKVTEPAQ